MGKLLFFAVVVGLILIGTGLWKILLVFWFPIIFLGMPLVSYIYKQR